MMIQGSNPLSMLPGLENGGAVQPGWLAEGGNNAAFTANLMQQLALLQANLANNANIDAGTLAGLQPENGAAEAGVAGQGVQNFAALFGTSLPTAKKIDQDINLDDTLNALSDVLQYLQSLEAGSAGLVPNPPAADAANQAAVVQETLADTAAQSGQDIDPAVLAAAMSASMQQAQPATVEPAAGDGSGESRTESAVAGSDVLAALKKAASAGKHEVFAAPQAGGDKQALGLDGETADAFLNQDKAPSNAEQDKLALLKNAEDDPAVQANPAKTAETDKNPARVATDIAQLNQAIRTEKTVEVPAMAKHFAHPEWNTELGEKLVWMHRQAVPSAEMRLNPQHLGPISIKIDVNQDQATVSFTAQHAAVRDAIEAAIPKLREMLGEQQLNLVDVNVSQQQSEQKQPRDFFRTAGQQGNGGNPGQGDETENPANQPAIDIVDEIESGRAIAGNGLLSLFA